MHIRDTRKCNMWNLETLAGYLAVRPRVLIRYYEELLDDKEFLDNINMRVRYTRNQLGFKKAIFSKTKISSLDWFAFERILLYVLIRHLKPRYCLETGVYYGGNTAFMLNALHKNGRGKLVSVDYPDSKIRVDKAFRRHPGVGSSELYDSSIEPGFIIPDYLRKYWDLRLGDSLKIIPKLDPGIEFYIHDSEHSYGFLTKELSKASKKLTDKATIVVDDIDWSNAFFEYCVKNELFPLCLTDNGKDNLRMRTGIAVLNHPKNSAPDITGDKRK